MKGLRGHTTVVAIVVAVTALVYAGCGADEVASPARSGEGPAGERAAGGSATTGPVEDYVAEADDFVNINEMTAVRGFFLDNWLGHLDEAVAIAEANEGGVYPVGTVIQLIPTEAMVKRAPGFSPETSDWEFFFLSVTEDGTEIIDRGTDEVVNQFGLDCASCHQLAEPKFDMVCETGETDHGCDPLPIGRDIIDAVQAADPRPR